MAHAVRPRLRHAMTAPMPAAAHAASPCSPAASAAPASCRACCTASRRRCRGSRRRRGHRRRQHRRRHLAARAEGLPRPRHRDVHPRRRHRPRARAGAARDETWQRQGGARGVRRRADLVRPRRPRPRHPPRAHPDARRRLPAQRRSPRRCAALAGSPGVAAAADDRRPGRDPRRHRRPRRAQRAGGSSTSRSTGCGCAPRCPAEAVVVGRARGRHARARACSRRSPTPTWCCCRRPTRSSRSAPILGVPGVREALRATPAPGRRPLPDRRRRTSARHGRRSCSTAIGVEVSAAGGRPCTTAPARAAGVLDGWLVDERRRRRGAERSRPPASPAAPCR